MKNRMHKPYSVSNLPNVRGLRFSDPVFVEEVKRLLGCSSLPGAGAHAENRSAFPATLPERQNLTSFTGEAHGRPTR